jgi:HAE1 family hydrophobic/amphiphilic exporter-1
VSQLLTLYITPVVYYYMDKMQEWVKARFGIGLNRQKQSGQEA